MALQGPRPLGPPPNVTIPTFDALGGYVHHPANPPIFDPDRHGGKTTRGGGPKFIGPPIKR